MNTDHSRQPELELCSRGSRRWRPSLQALPATSAPAGPGQQPGSRVNPTSCERAVLRHVLFLFQDLIPTLGRAVLSPHTASSPLTQQGSRPNLLLQRGRFFISRRFALQSWEAARSAALPVKLSKKRKGRPASPPWGAPPEVVPLSFLEGGPSLHVSSSWDVGI